jgi:hypothetical protein
MTGQGPSPYRSAGRADQATSGWVVGFLRVGAIMMLMVGLLPDGRWYGTGVTT